MKKTVAKVRLYVEQDFAPEKFLYLSESQSHYLCNVMRLNQGNIISCFNSTSGEYKAEITQIHKKQTQIKLIELLRNPHQVPDIWLLFAPLKKDRTDFLVEKAVELGVSRLVPIISDYAITDKMRSERIIAQMIEASEQCERTDIPALAEPLKLTDLLHKWDKKRKLYFMDERRDGKTCAEVFASSPDSCAIMIGPEGGFSNSEAQLLHQLDFVETVSLGPRILRAETAAVAALSVWQAIAGDWRK